MARFVAAFALLALASVAAARPFNATGGAVIRLVEHATTDTVVYVNPAGGDALGNTLTFGNPLFDEADGTQVGRDAGHCVRAYVGEMWECRWTAYLKEGSLSVEGPFYDAHDSDLIVTGGTGAFVGARGVLHLGHRDKEGKEYSFVYELLP